MQIIKYKIQVKTYKMQNYQIRKCRLRWIVENSEPTIGGRQVFIIITMMIIFNRIHLILSEARSLIIMIILVKTKYEELKVNATCVKAEQCLS